jgi:hypothetical protein
LFYQAQYINKEGDFMTKQKTISIQGNMYALTLLAVSDEDLERLIEASDNEDDFWEDIDDIQDEISGGAVINGYAIDGATPEFQVFVDGIEQPEILKAFVKSLPSLKTQSWFTFESGKHYLVYEEWFSNGESTLAPKGGVDLEDLSLSIDEQELPDGTKRQVVSTSYSGEDLEFEESSPEDISLYVIKSNGERINLL